MIKTHRSTRTTDDGVEVAQMVRFYSPIVGRPTVGVEVVRFVKSGPNRGDKAILLELSPADVVAIINDLLPMVGIEGQFTAQAHYTFEPGS